MGEQLVSQVCLGDFKVLLTSGSTGAPSPKMVIAPHDHDMGSTTERAATPSYVGHPAMPDGYKINRRARLRDSVCKSLA